MKNWQKRSLKDINTSQKIIDYKDFLEKHGFVVFRKGELSELLELKSVSSVIENILIRKHKDYLLLNHKENYGESESEGK